MDPSITGSLQGLLFTSSDFSSHIEFDSQPELLGFLYPIFMSIFITLVQKEYVEEGAPLFPSFFNSNLTRISPARSFLEKHRADHEPGYTEEIDRVKGISTAQHIIENAISAMFFRDKYILKVSREAVDLLIYFILVVFFSFFSNKN